MDNQFFNCPARMEDGRIFTTYYSSQIIIDSIKKANGINICDVDNNDTRLFLQRNAVKLMDREREFLARNNTCKLPKKPIVIMLPYAQNGC
jgi:hypothetical protein